MIAQTKFQITTRNGRQRALWLRLFGSDALPVTAAAPHEVYTPDGRARLVYDLDVVAIGPNGRRRLAAYIAARRWGVAPAQAGVEQALRDVAFGWTIDATDCELASEPVTEPWQNSPVDAPGAISGPTCATKRPCASPAKENAAKTGVRPFLVRDHRETVKRAPRFVAAVGGGVK